MLILKYVYREVHHYILPLSNTFIYSNSCDIGLNKKNKKNLVGQTDLCISSFQSILPIVIVRIIHTNDIVQLTENCIKRIWLKHIWSLITLFRCLTNVIIAKCYTKSNIMTWNLCKYKWNYLSTSLCYLPQLIMTAIINEVYTLRNDIL